MVHLFNITVKNVLHNFILHEIVTCDDRDPPWINNLMWRLVKEKNEVYKRFKSSNNSSQHFENFNAFRV